MDRWFSRITRDRDTTPHERDAVFWTERSYGSFCRVIPLSPGAITDSAKATFNNGVIEVVMQAPSQEERRGTVDIAGSPGSEDQDQVR